MNGMNGYRQNKKSLFFYESLILMIVSCHGTVSFLWHCYRIIQCNVGPWLRSYHCLPNHSVSPVTSHLQTDPSHSISDTSHRSNYEKVDDYWGRYGGWRLSFIDNILLQSLSICVLNILPVCDCDSALLWSLGVITVNIITLYVLTPCFVSCLR